MRRIQRTTHQGNQNFHTPEHSDSLGFKLARPLPSNFWTFSYLPTQEKVTKLQATAEAWENADLRCIRKKRTKHNTHWAHLKPWPPWRSDQTMGLDCKGGEGLQPTHEGYLELCVRGSPVQTMSKLTERWSRAMQWGGAAATSPSGPSPPRKAPSSRPSHGCGCHITVSTQEEYVEVTSPMTPGGTSIAKNLDKKTLVSHDYASQLRRFQGCKFLPIYIHWRTYPLYINIPLTHCLKTVHAFACPECKMVWHPMKALHCMEHEMHQLLGMV